jgi:hypothetical protein
MILTCRKKPLFGLKKAVLGVNLGPNSRVWNTALNALAGLEGFDPIKSVRQVVSLLAQPST